MQQTGNGLRYIVKLCYLCKMIELQQAYELRGSCVGITSTQVERTTYKALYLRSDGYYEAFRIRTDDMKVYKDGEWVKTGERYERYPTDESFGDWAWCGKRNIREIYDNIKPPKNDQETTSSRGEASDRS